MQQKEPKSKHKGLWLLIVQLKKGLEPSTPSLRVKCSTSLAVLQQENFYQIFRLDVSFSPSQHSQWFVHEFAAFVQENDFTHLTATDSHRTCTCFPDNDYQLYHIFSTDFNKYLNLLIFTCKKSQNQLIKDFGS